MSSDNSVIWARLRKGEGLQGLRVPTVGGRSDLRRLAAPQPTVQKRIRTTFGDVEQLEGFIEMRNATWSSLDLSRGRLERLHFVDSRIEDCVFEKSRCKRWKLWGTTVTDTSFRSADLRGTVLGGVIEGRRSVFCRVDFSGADLRGTIYEAAAFVGCTFRDTKLTKVDFQSSTFEDCTFEGDLDEVLFNRTGFEGESFPPNEMRNVDFSRARLRWVGFRGLDLSHVRLPPEDAVITDYRATLERVIRVYEGRTDPISRQIAGFLQHKLKWAGPDQTRGVLSRFDIVDMWGEKSWEDLLKLIRA